MNILQCLAALVVVFHFQVSFALDFYKVLGVPRDAEKSEIKKSYHRLALELHPDKNDYEPGSPEAEEAVRRFIEVSTAYEVLSDEKRRKRYDTLGPDHGNGGSDSYREPVVVRNYDQEPFDLSIRFNGGAFEFHYKRETPKRVGNMRVPVPITLEELYRGKTIMKTITRKRICQHCNGTGAEHDDHIHTCTLCQGTGRCKFLNDDKHERHQKERSSEDSDEFDFDRFDDETEDAESGEFSGHTKHRPLFQQIVQTKCTRCGGTGQFTEEKHRCKICGGERTVMEPKVYELVVVRGAFNTKWHFEGEGGQAYRQKSGDVDFYLRVLPHATLRRDGHDLKLALEVSLVEALVGFKRNITHLDGRTITIVHDIVTYNGHSILMKGEGMPIPPGTIQGDDKPEENEVYGNLITTFDIVFPRRLTEKQKEALRTVMDEDDISILEDVIRLAAAGEDLHEFENEKVFTTYCKHADECTHEPFAFLGVIWNR